MNTPAEITAWNQAHERLRLYLETFSLGDEIQLERIALRLLDEAREKHDVNPARSPTAVTLRHAQDELGRWLARYLDEPGQTEPQVLAGGTIALLISGLAGRQPWTFLAEAPSPEVRDALRRSLVVAGPDLTVSSMTPRHLDYGPMLDLARQTWHRWDTKSFVAAVLFWLGVYGICYWCLSEYL